MTGRLPEQPGAVTAGSDWLNNLAGLYRDTGRSAEAEPLFKRVLSIFEKALGPEHPHLMWGREDYADLLDQARPPCRGRRASRSSPGDPVTVRAGVVAPPSALLWPKLGNLRRAALLRQIG